MAEESARREYVVAHRDKQAAEAGVGEAIDNSALAQAAVRKATDDFHAIR